MSFRLQRWLVVGLVVAAVAPSVVAQPSPQVTLKFGTVVGVGHPVNDAAYEFARVAEERSKGRIKVQVFPGNQLAKGESAMVEGLQIGSVDVSAIGSAPLGGIYEPMFQALDLPFLWSSREQVAKVLDGPIGRELMKKLEGKGLKALTFGGGYGFRNMMSNKRAIVTPDDMRGQTIRVQESPTYIALMKALGANPIPLPMPEVYLAMKQGTVDGMDQPAVGAVADHFYEVAKFYSITRHAYSPIVYLMSTKAYESLGELKPVIDEAAAAARAVHRKADADKEQGAFETMRKAGVQINEVKDLKAFQDRMTPVYQAVAAKAGKEFVDRVVAAAAAAR